MYVVSLELYNYVAFTFSLRGSTLQLDFGISEFSVSYSCTLASFLSKIRIIWIQALNTMTVDLITEMPTKPLMDE